METFNLVQGSDEWHKFRSEHCPASEYPAVMSKSKYTKRHELMSERKNTGVTEHSNFTLGLFAKGHEAEDNFRPILEEIIGEELYPVTGRLEGTLLTASFDGLTMDYSAGFEHKLWNEKLAKLVLENNPEVLEEHFKLQMDQQLKVSGAEKIYFVTSDGTRENYAMMEYPRDEERLLNIEDNWKLFMEELEIYDPDVNLPPEAAKPASAAIMELPALMISIEGKVNESNLVPYKEAALEFIDSINKDLKTDEDFADAENMVKFCSSAEKKLETAKKNALAQTVTIEKVFESIDVISEKLRSTRLDLSKLVKVKKDEMKHKLMAKFRLEVGDYLKTLNDALDTEYSIAPPLYDFIGAIKGKRNLKSMSDSLSEYSAKLKVEINGTVELIKRNDAVISETMATFDYLVNDKASLVHMDTYELSVLLKERLEAEKARQKAVEDAAEEKRIADKKAELVKQEQAEEAGRIAKESAENREVELKQNIADAAGVQPEDVKVDIPAETSSEASVEKIVDFKSEIKDWIRKYELPIDAIHDLSEILKKYKLV